jgi:Tfp pilus assembly protein PilF
MAKLEIKYRTSGGVMGPRVPKVSFETWAGSPELKKENGSQPQPWHCPLHVSGCTHGVELIYSHETETRIFNDNGRIRIEWDRKVDPDGSHGPKNFTLSAPPPSQNYLFATGLDIQVPPGYVLRTEPHPRFFSDTTGAAPAAMYGHVQSEWWPKKLFMVFKIPFPGQCHIFRKGDAYAQVLVIPDDACEVVQMTPEEESRRRQLEDDIRVGKSLIGKRVWHSAGGVEFNDHYTVLARVYDKEGIEGVERVAREAVHRYKTCVPAGLTVPEYFQLANQYRAESRYTEAKEVLHCVMRAEPHNAEVYNQISRLEWELGVAVDAVRTLRLAVELQPKEATYRRNLGEFYRRLGRINESHEQFAVAVSLRPNDPELLTVLSVILVQLGRAPEALDRCRLAAQLDPRSAATQMVLGMIQLQLNRPADARSCFETALALDPNFTPAREALGKLPPASVASPA